MENSNEKVLKIIERQYAGFIDLQDRWNFFRGLAEYTETIQKMTWVSPLVEALEKQREMSQKAYELMGATAMKELTKSAERMTSITDGILKQYEPSFRAVQEIANKYQPVIEAMKELRERMAGHILSSNPISCFESDLFDVARHVRASGHADAIKEFEDNERRTKNIYGNYTFSPTYAQLEEEKGKVERKEQTEPWGAWQHLPMVRRLVFEPEEITAELRAEAKNDRSFEWTFLNFMGVAGEMEKIRENKVSGNDIVYFRMKDFRSYAQRVHSHITTELLKADTMQPTFDFRFDDEKKVLNFMNKKILVAKKEESDTHKLMRTLFKDKHKNWANDEVLEDWGYAIDEETATNKVYQAGRKINGLVAQDTTIKDFLIVTTKSISINKKHLPT